MLIGLCSARAWLDTAHSTVGSGIWLEGVGGRDKETLEVVTATGPHQKKLPVASFFL